MRKTLITLGLAGLLLIGAMGCEDEKPHTFTDMDGNILKFSDEEMEIMRENAAEREENRRKGFHCLSDWDGNHNGTEKLVRLLLHDPDSMKTYSTSITPVMAGTGKHRLVMDYGARNAFGAMVRNQAKADIDPDTCEATLLTVGE